MTEPARIDRLGAAEFREHAGVAASIYGQAMHRPAEIVVQRREVIVSHLRNPGFVAATAVVDDAVVGFGYGYRGAPGQWWYDVVARGLGRDATRRWLHQGFELAELHVLPEHQGRGIGRRLLDDVMARTDAGQVLLSTPDIESPARLLYRSRGFLDLLRDFSFPGSSEAYAVMGCDIGRP
jgi:ribosomal protein S18 acetylase RimI-like enzyme